MSHMGACLLRCQDRVNVRKYSVEAFDSLTEQFGVCGTGSGTDNRWKRSF